MVLYAHRRAADHYAVRSFERNGISFGTNYFRGRRLGGGLFLKLPAYSRQALAVPIPVPISLFAHIPDSNMEHFLGQNKEFNPLLAGLFTGEINGVKFHFL